MNELYIIILVGAWACHLGATVTSNMGDVGFKNSRYTAIITSIIIVSLEHFIN